MVLHLRDCCKIVLAQPLVPDSSVVALDIGILLRLAWLNVAERNAMVVRADESPQARERWSYILLAEELRRISAKPKLDAAELFRRMCFNALITNIDDHPRNHAVIARDRDWRLSPAYDLTPSSPVSIERRDLAMACGDEGRYARAKNLMTQSARFLLAADEAARIIRNMETQVRSTWYEVARGCRVSEADCALIAGAFSYPGFGA